VEGISSYEGIGKIFKQLDQRAEGLKSLGVLNNEALSRQLFIQSTVSSEDVSTNMKFQKKVGDGNKMAAGHLQRFVAKGYIVYV